jgi:NTE family protein
VPDQFEGLKIPFVAIATDFHLRAEVALSSGPLTPAVGASMAIPGLIRPVLIDGRVLIDGGAVTPLPVPHVMGEGMLTICCDVLGASFVSDTRIPEPIEAMFGASQILMTAVAARSLDRHRPDLLLRPDVGQFAGLDFFRAGEILAAAEPIKEQLKRGLDAALKQAP